MYSTVGKMIFPTFLCKKIHPSLLLLYSLQIGRNKSQCSLKWECVSGTPTCTTLGINSVFLRHCANWEEHDVFSLVLSVCRCVRVDTLITSPPGMCIRGIPPFQCVFGKTETCNMHKNRTNCGFVKEAHFWLIWTWLSPSPTAQPGTLTPTWCKRSLFFTGLRYERTKHPRRPWWEVPPDLWHPTHTYFCPGLSWHPCREGLCLSWNFMNSLNLSFQLEGWKRTSRPLTRPRSARTQLQSPKGRPSICRLPSPGVLAPSSLPLSAFSYCFHKIFHSK